MGGVRCPMACEVRLEPRQVQPALAEDVDEVHRHAAGKAEGQRLHRRLTGYRRAVESRADAAGGCREYEVVLPEQLDSGRVACAGERPP